MIRSLLNVTDLISSTHVIGLLVGLLVVRVHFGQFSIISTGRSCETWSQDLMRLGLIDSHENSCLTRVIGVEGTLKMLSSHVVPVLRF
jgi:hypothetical protein